MASKQSVPTSWLTSTAVAERIKEGKSFSLTNQDGWTVVGRIKRRVHSRKDSDIDPPCGKWISILKKLHDNTHRTGEVSDGLEKIMGRRMLEAERRKRCSLHMNESLDVFLRIYDPEIFSSEDGPGISKRMSPYGEEIPYRVFTLYSLGISCPWKVFSTKTPLYPLVESASFRQVEQWIQRCGQGHRCLERVQRDYLPTRVLDVSDNPSSVVTLRQSRGLTGRYICLSHCWGDHLTLITNQQNMRAFMESGIPWSSIPKTYQDVMTLARRLSVQFVWIDSLCIVQDDKDDWATESQDMARVYANSWLTIAATSAPDSQAGLPRDDGAVTIRGTTLGAKEFRLQVRQGEADLDHPDWLTTRWQGTTRIWDIKDTWPLLTRAWVLQERILSPRVLHMAFPELIWECHNLTFCECGKLKSNGESESYHEIFNVPVGNFAWRWREIVVAYSQLDLTFVEDRLPAISGLAKAFPGACLEDYRAGMWRESLPHDLLWSLTEAHGRPDTYTFEVKRNPGVPSWSWAAWNYPITYPGYSGFSGNNSWRFTTTWFKILDSGCELATQDPTGPVESGHVTLECDVFATTAKLPHFNGLAPKLSKHNDDSIARIRWDDLGERDDHGRPIAVTAIRLGEIEADNTDEAGEIYTEVHEYAMIVEPVDFDRKVYRRVGLAKFFIGENRYIGPGWDEVWESPFSAGGSREVVTLV